MRTIQCPRCRQRQAEVKVPALGDRPEPPRCEICIKVEKLEALADPARGGTEGERANAADQARRMRASYNVPEPGTYPEFSEFTHVVYDEVTFIDDVDFEKIRDYVNAAGHRFWKTQYEGSWNEPQEAGIPRPESYEWMLKWRKKELYGKGVRLELDWSLGEMNLDWYYVDGHYLRLRDLDERAICMVCIQVQSWVIAEAIARESSLYRTGRLRDSAGHHRLQLIEGEMRRRGICR